MPSNAEAMQCFYQGVVEKLTAKGVQDTYKVHFDSNRLYSNNIFSQIGNLPSSIGGAQVMVILVVVAATKVGFPGFPGMSATYM